MEIDLENSGEDLEALSARLRSQVCIVGGGIAGLILAHRLMLGGVTVTLLEAGGRAPATERGVDSFCAELRGVPHRGTEEGRVRALGGSSWTWGGQLLPIPEDACWPVSATEIRQQGAHWGLPSDAAQFFKANQVRLPRLLEDLPGLVPRLSRFTPFSRRNLAKALGKKLLASSRVKVALRASVAELVLSPDGGRVVSAAVRMPTGETLRVEADAFVVAAGTVETCRLLLVSKSGAGEAIGNEYGQVGQNFHDHLTVSAAVFTGPARERMLAELGPWVLRSQGQKRAVYSMKLEPSAGLRAELGLHRAMAHLTVEELEDSGVGQLRRLLRAVKTGDSGGAVQGLVKRLPQVVWHGFRLGWDARVRHRRYVSPQATVRLQLNVAQDAPSASRVLLSEVCDGKGMPRAVVDWRISAAELATFRGLANYLRERLESAGIRDGVAWEPSLFAEGDARDRDLLRQVDDARHAMGGACMGNDPRSSVVDTHLRVHGVANLYLASPAVFPDGSAQLPTLTLSALCLRLVDRLTAEFATSDGARLHSK